MLLIVAAISERIVKFNAVISTSHCFTTGNLSQHRRSSSEGNFVWLLNEATNINEVETYPKTVFSTISHSTNRISHVADNPCTSNEHLIVDLLSDQRPETSHNKNQNNCDNTSPLHQREGTTFSCTPSTSTTATELLTNPLDFPVPTPRTRRKVSLNYKSPLLPHASSSPAPVKPPVPHKRGELERITSPLHSQRQRLTLPIDSTMEDKGISYTNNSAPETTATGKKLPPPPRPSAPPKRKTSHVATLDIDDNFGYAKIGSVLRDGVSNDKQLDHSNLKTPTDNVHWDFPVEGSDNSALSLVEKGNTVPEPTYACIKKLHSPKKPTLRPKPKARNASPHDDQPHKEETERLEICLNTVPPPIPTNRPPLEDYCGITLNSAQTTHVAQEVCCADSNAKKFDDITTIKNTPPKPLARIGKLPNASVMHVDAVQDMSSQATDETSDSIVAEPPYEKVFFIRKSDTVQEKPTSSPPPKIQSPHKPSIVPPPLPTTQPVGNAGIQQIECDTVPEKKGTSGGTVTRKGSGTSRGISIIRKKSLKIKEKSLKIFKHHNSLDGMEDSLNESSAAIDNQVKQRPNVQKANTSHLSPSNSSGKNQQSFSACDSEALKARKTEKPKRTPPPRPAMPLVLRNKNQHTGSNLNHSPSSVDSLTIKSSMTITTTDSLGERQNASDGVKSTIQSAHKPHPHKPPPPSTSIKVQEESSNRDALDLTNLPLPKPRSKTNTKSSNNGKYQESTALPKNSATLNKPSRPPPPPPMSSIGHGVIRNHPAERKKDEEELKEKSFLEILKDNDVKREVTGKSQIDQKMKSYIFGELQYVATEDYHPENFTDLSFTKDEKIIVIKRIDERLLFGRNEEGEEGPFPEKYVHLAEADSNNSNSNSLDGNNADIRFANKVIGKALAIYTFNSHKAGDLSFVVGDTIDVFGCVGDKWFQGQIYGKIGIFPRNFVSYTPIVNKNAQDSLADQQCTVTALHAFEGTNNNELSFNAGDKINVICHINDHWLKGRCKGFVGIFPNKYVNYANLQLPEGSNFITPLIESSSDNAGNYSSSIKGEQMQSDTPPCTAVALYSFNGEDDSELTFQTNDVISITKIVNKDWFEGKLRGKTGIFPAIFVKTKVI